MPSTSKKQHNFMAAVANNPSFAKKVGVPQSVGKDFNDADKGKTFKQGGNMKKMNMGGYADGGMPMVNKGGKMVPSFAADGVGKMKKGGMTKKMAGGGMAASSMGKVKTAAPSKDGVAVKGKTKGKQIVMKKGGMC